MVGSVDGTFGERPLVTPTTPYPPDDHAPIFQAPAPATRAESIDAPGPIDAATSAVGGPSESARYAMFVILIVVMASAPTWVAYRAIKEGRAVDFPLGGSLGTTAILLFAMVALALLSVCFWPSLNAAAWTAPTTGTLIGASGVAMAFLGGTHAVAGLIGTGFLSEPAWLAWLVLIGVYPIAGQVALRLVRDFIGPNALKPGTLDDRDPDDEFWSREQSPFTGARAFGQPSESHPGNRPSAGAWPPNPRHIPDDLAAATNAAIDEDMDRSQGAMGGDPRFHAPPPASGTGPAAAAFGDAPFGDAHFGDVAFGDAASSDVGYDDDPFADPSDSGPSAPGPAHAQPVQHIDPAPAGSGGWDKQANWDDDGEWDEEEDWDDDPFA